MLISFIESLPSSSPSKATLSTFFHIVSYGKEKSIEAATIANAYDFIRFVSINHMCSIYYFELGCVLVFRQVLEVVGLDSNILLNFNEKEIHEGWLNIAPARAMFENPAILFLDETTSALDINSDKLVQDTEEKAMLGRTCLVVAHRLPSGQNKIK